jgi:ribosomal protein S17E
MAFKFSRSLETEVQKKAGQYILKKNPKILTEEFEVIKQKMIQEFRVHPVTKEINGSLSASNTSQTLSGINNDGNLFTFIGFELNSDPITPIEEVLLKIKIDIVKEYNLMYIVIKNYPDPNDIWDVTPMPWQEGRSWAKGIESGISGLNYYFHLKQASERSRSSEGVQLHRARTNARFIPVKYMTELLKKYKTIFSSKYAKNKNVFVSLS